MNDRLSKRINELPTSATLAMAAKARELREQGKDIIGLSLGEPDFNTPDFVKEAAIQAINDNYNSYTPVDGYRELKEAIQLKFKRDNHLDYELDQIVVSTGAKQTIANIAMSLLNKGDECIMPAPYWVSYEAIVQLAEGKAVPVHAGVDQNFKITPEQLRDAITPRTKMVLYSSPNNPSGAVYSRAELEGLAEVLRDYPDIIVVSDEIYEHINYTDDVASMAQIEGMYDRTVTVNGVSKAFAMTGWRIGYMGGPAWIAKACTKMQGQITSGANCIAQRAVIAALQAPVSKISYMIDAFAERREIMYRHLKQIPGLKTEMPDGAFYFFPDVSEYFGRTISGKQIETATDLSLLILTECNVATVTGEAFGAPNCIRLSYAASKEEINTAMERIQSLLKN
jgi:aspartate aminotransferase